MDDFNESIPEHILGFCIKNHIMPYLFIKLDMIEENFGIKEEVYMSIRVNDRGEERLYIEVEVDMEDDVLQECYADFLRDWVTEVPWPERDLIKLEFITPTQ